MLTIIDTKAATSVLAATILAFFATMAAGDTLTAKAMPPKHIKISEIETAFAVDPTSPEVNPEYVKKLAIEYFADIPVMVSICECESKFEHYRSDGTLNVSRARDKKGKRASSATGACQILYKGNYHIWANSPTTDITTVLGNFEAARNLYLSDGVSPWHESESCWRPKMHQYDARIASN